MQKILKQAELISIYIVAITIANLLVAKFGTNVVLPVAFVFIGLDLVTRDLVHEQWHGKIWLKMGLLILSGSALSWLISYNAARVAIASFIAFAVSQTLDTITYAILRKKAYLIKVNGSNVASSFTDSALFITIAFNSFMPLLILEQFATKFIGSFVWALIFKKRVQK